MINSYKQMPPKQCQTSRIYHPSKSLNTATTDIIIMPKPGYTTITLKTEVAQLLKQKARAAGLGLNQYLLALLNQDSPRTVPPIKENNPKPSFSSKTEGRRRDLNPASGLHRPVRCQATLRRPHSAAYRCFLDYSGGAGSLENYVGLPSKFFA